MSQSFPVTPVQSRASLDDLREALRVLKPTGSTGFEGLLARVLSKISHHDFRLAKSGLQNGKDGESVDELLRISFEAKLYKNKINDNEVLTKITRIIGSSTPPDLWILGATVEASTQLLDPLQAATSKTGIEVLVLDWPDASAAPPLAVACALAQEETLKFLETRSVQKSVVEKAAVALEVLRGCPQFDEAAKRIREALCTPSLSLDVARRANRTWLEGILSDRARAKAEFGQALAPNAAAALTVRFREGLIDRLRALMITHSPRKIVALTGGEGRGKSWLFAQHWLSLDKRPLTLFVPASEIDSVAPNSIEPFLLNKLIYQTGEKSTERTRNRWERIFGSWKQAESPSQPRLIVCIDGLNQNAELDWPRWLDNAAHVLDELGGVLVVTCRDKYFCERIRTAIHTSVLEIDIKNWSAAELKDILAAEGLNSASIAPNVLSCLQNPRILGIAFELLDTSKLQDFAELSVERLLFEHIRFGPRDGNAPEPPEVFAHRLAQHAQDVIDRARSQQMEDRFVFSRALGRTDRYELTSELMAVTSEHFFEQLPDDPMLYRLSDEGLTLALGISLIRSLQKAERNERNLSEALDEIIEPIEALDKTADAVLSAILVSSADDACSVELLKTLLITFLRLQNIDPSGISSFAGSVRNAPSAAMQALRATTQSNLYSANKGWLVAALHQCRHDHRCWPEISENLRAWLRTYSLDPSISLLGTISRASTEEIEREKDKRTKALRKRCRELSEPEQAFLQEQMRRDDACDPSHLIEEALKLLSGGPLADFSTELVAASMSLSLNSGYSAPYDEFSSLVRFNREDWSATVDQLRASSHFLTEGRVSRTGKWALVTIARAISTPDAGALEDELVAELTADREFRPSWREVERYCSTDPCDPQSERPENIDATSERYLEIDVGEVAKHRWAGADDHFMRDARPGLARFLPETAIAVHRAVAHSVLQREKTSELMLGITTLEPHTAILDSGNLSRLIEIAQSFARPYEPKSQTSRDSWITSQFALLAAFPHLEGNCQIKTLQSLPSNGPTLLRLIDVYKPGDPALLEQLLQDAVDSGDHWRVVMALSFAHTSGTDLTDTTRRLICLCLESDDTSVRSEAMDIVAHHDDSDLLKAFAGMEWTSDGLDQRENFSEIVSGSYATLRVAESGLVSAEEVMQRISPKAYSAAVRRFGKSVDRKIAARLLEAARTAVDARIPFAPPAVEQQIEGLGRSEPPLLSLIESEEFEDPKAFFERANETPEEFQARQEDGWASFSRFEAELTRERARLILEDVGFDAADALVSALSDDASSFAEAILTAERTKLPNIRNFGLTLARALSDKTPSLAKRLYERLSRERSIVYLTYGPSGATHQAICSWRSTDSEEMNELRFRRLNEATTDHELAQEVIAALLSEKSHLVEAYAKSKLEEPEPASKARALMVLGFAGEADYSASTISDHLYTKGLIGEAAKASQYAYERNIWSKFWFSKMCNSESGEEFWRYSTLFLKIVDARFAVWSNDIVRSGEAAQRFETSILQKTESRIKSWKKKREKTLFGTKAPDAVFFAA